MDGLQLESLAFCLLTFTEGRERRMSADVNLAVGDGGSGIDSIAHFVSGENLRLGAKRDDGDGSVSRGGEELVARDDGRGVVGASGACANLVFAFAGLQVNAGKETSVLDQVDELAIGYGGRNFGDASGGQGAKQNGRCCLCHPRRRRR